MRAGGVWVSGRNKTLKGALLPTMTASDATAGPNRGVTNGAPPVRRKSSGRVIADADIEPLVGAAIARGERHAWTYQPGVAEWYMGFPIEWTALPPLEG